MTQAPVPTVISDDRYEVLAREFIIGNYVASKITGEPIDPSVPMMQALLRLLDKTRGRIKVADKAALFMERNWLRSEKDLEQIRKNYE